MPKADANTSVSNGNAIERIKSSESRIVARFDCETKNCESMSMTRVLPDAMFNTSIRACRARTSVTKSLVDEARASDPVQLCA